MASISRLISSFLMLTMFMCSQCTAEHEQLEKIDVPTGMAIRISQKQIEQFKRAMMDFLPHYIEFDWTIPKEEDWDIYTFFGLWRETISFTEIKYNKPDFNIKDSVVKFEEIFGNHILKVNLPTMKKWRIEAKTHSTSFLVPDSDIYFAFNDFDMKFNTVFDLTEKGYLKPVLFATDLKFGESIFYHDNWFLRIITH